MLNYQVIVIQNYVIFICAYFYEKL